MQFIQEKDFAPVRLADISAGVREDLRLRRNLRRLSWGTRLISLIVLILFIVLMTEVWQMLQRSFASKVEGYTHSYSVALQRTAMGELNSLRMFSMLLSEGIGGQHQLMQHTRYLSSFDAIFYWGKDGRQAYLTADGKWLEGGLNQLSPAHVEAIAKAQAGKATLSSSFRSQLFGQQMIAYAVPVFSDSGSAVGALTAVKNLNAFTQLLPEISGPNVHLHLAILDAHGQVMIAWGSDNFRFKPNVSLYALQGLSAKQVVALKQAAATKQRYHLHFTHRGNNWGLTLLPVGFADWNIVAFSNFSTIASPFFSELSRLAFLLTIVFASVLVLNFVASSLIHRSYRRQISLSFYDPLTHGYNLRKFMIELSRKVFRRGSWYLVAFNVRDFRYVNEYAGSRNADKLLQLISQQALAQSKIVLSCREQGDQFYFLVQAKQEEQARSLLLQMCQDISAVYQPYFAIFPICCYGGVFKFDNQLPPEEQLHRAKLVQHTARKMKGTVMLFYDEELYMQLQHRQEIEKAMRPALEHGEFRLYLQPKFDLHKQRVTAAEALVRWHSADGTVLLPGQFMPIFDKNGFSAKLDLFMLEQTCAFIRKTLDAGLQPMCISVNQCKELLFSGDYLDKVHALLQRYQIPPHLVVIEVLESIMAQDLQRLNPYLIKLRSLGVGIALDDFGTGYSSLNMLSTLQVNEIKFDKAFLLEPDRIKKAKNKIILQQFQSIVYIFNAHTVVEGVENAEDAFYLQQAGFDLAQGFFYSKPLPEDSFVAQFMHKSQLLSLPKEAESSLPQFTVTPPNLEK